MKKMTLLDQVAMALVIIGGLNWGLVGILGTDWNLVVKIFGESSVWTSAVYDLVGLATLWIIWTVIKVPSQK